MSVGDRVQDDTAETKATASESSGAARRFMRSAGARILVLPLSGLAALLATNLVVTNYGIGSYAVYALVASLPFLFPLSDLGLGAALTNAAAALPEGRENFIRLLKRARLILIGVALTFVAITIVIAALELWPRILGIPDSKAINLGVMAALLVFAASIPASLGARILAGLRKNVTVVVIQGLISTISLLLILLGLLFDQGIGFILAASIGGLTITNWLCYIIARRSQAVRSLSHEQTDTSTRIAKLAIWNTALPMLVISASLPLAFQTARLILSWSETVAEVAIYSAAAMLYFPVVSVVSVAGRSLWGDFARLRATNQKPQSLFKRAIAISSIAGLVGGSGLALIGPSLSNLTTDGLVRTPSELYLAFGVLVLLQAVHTPSGMYLTDSVGLRFQAITTAVMGFVAVALAFVLTPALGATGPVVATAIALFACQVCPCLIAVKRDMRRLHDPAGDELDPLLSKEQESNCRTV